MTFLRLLRAGFHSLFLFVLPWGVGLVASACVDVKQVSETSARLAMLFAYITVPLALLQGAAISVKVRREQRSLALGRALGNKKGIAAFAVALDRHARVLSARGLGLAAVAGILVSMALAAKFAELGVLAAAAIGLLYLMATWALLVSAFSVGAFDARVARARGSIEREVSPSVVDAGDEVVERFLLARVPVPPGFRLHIDEDLPPRLGGATRFALDRSISRAEASVSAPLPRTARGVYQLGPAAIWYEDLLGLTRIFVASRATASVRVLPRLRPISLHERPRSLMRSDGRLSILRRQASEDFFATREYRRGDELRRVHWRQSVNSGSLHVRIPEAVPFAPERVRLVLDTFLPAGVDADDPRIGDLLDLLVEGWVAIANALVQRGERVTLAMALRADVGGEVAPRELACKRGEERKLRAFGADAAWQSRVPLDLAVSTGWQAQVTQVVISAGFAPLTLPGASLLLADAGDRPSAPPPPSLWRRALFHSYPVGAEDNAFDLRRQWARALRGVQAFRRARKPPSSRDAAADPVTTAFAAALEHARQTDRFVMCLRRRGPQLALEAP